MSCAISPSTRFCAPVGLNGRRFFYRLANAFSQREGNSRALAHLAPLQFQSDFKEEQLFKDQPLVRRSSVVLQIGKSFAFRRKMHLCEGRPAIEQFQAAAKLPAECRQGCPPPDFPERHE